MGGGSKKKRGEEGRGGKIKRKRYDPTPPCASH